MGQSKTDTTRGLFRLGRKPTILASAVAVVALTIPAVAEAKQGKRGGPKVTVMTRNVFLGADLTPAIDAPNLGEAIDATGTILAEVDASQIPKRAIPLAREIKKSNAHLVGLQEVALWRQQVPSDLPPEFGGTEATDVRYDFLAELEKRLAKINAKYKVVHVQQEFDQELPVDQDKSDATGGLNGADLDGRLTMRDVILAKKGGKLKLGEATGSNFETLFAPAVGGIPLDVERGWQSVDAKVKGGGKGKNASASNGRTFKFRFANTHLEAFDSTVREAQAKELIAPGGPLNTKKQSILVGDINSGGKKDKVEGADRLAYNALTGFGFKRRGARQSCCFSDLFDGSQKFDHTVDHVLTKPRLDKRNAFITGDDRSVFKRYGLWPSDHGGVVSKLTLKK